MGGRLGIALALVLAASGCTSTMKDVVAAKARGTTEVYPMAPAKAWEISESVLWEATRVAPEDYKDRGFVCLKGGLGSDETLIAVWVEPRPDPRESRVTVVCRRSSGLQIAVVLTEAEFHERFRQAAGLKRKGGL
jgi:hypothetical protein